MLTRIALRLIVMIGVLGCAGVALGQDRVHNYFNDTALKVKATESPVQKREILSKSLGDMTKMIITVESSSCSDVSDVLSTKMIITVES